MPRFTFIVDINIEDNIAKKYPNYKEVWESAEEFAKSRLTSTASLEKHGYEITNRIITREEAMLINTTLNP